MDIVKLVLDNADHIGAGVVMAVALVGGYKGWYHWHREWLVEHEARIAAEERDRGNAKVLGEIVVLLRGSRGLSGDGQ